MTVSIPAALLDRFYWDANREMYTHLMPIQRRQSSLQSAQLSAAHAVLLRPEGFFVLVVA
jgi:hypothetical protein